MSWAKLYIFLIVSNILALIYTDTSYAYIDPGTGSYVFQIIIAFFIGALFAVKQYFHRIKLFIMNMFNRGERKP